MSDGRRQGGAAGLVEFLQARLDEDERMARAVESAASAALVSWAEHPRVELTDASFSSRWSIGEEDQEGGFRITAGTYTAIRDGRTEAQPWVIVGPGYTGGGVHERETAEHIARHDSARVLAEVESKRKLIEQHVGYYGGGDDEFWPVQTLRLLALPYADHPDYDESWRP